MRPPPGLAGTQAAPSTGARTKHARLSHAPAARPKPVAIFLLLKDNRPFFSKFRGERTTDGSGFRPSSDRALPHPVQCDTGRKVHAMNSDRQYSGRIPPVFAPRAR